MNILANTFKEDFNLFLKNYALRICLAIVAIIVITIIIVFVIKNKNPKAPKETHADSEWVEALGGKENVKDVSAMGSRLNVVLEKIELMNKEKLSELGITNIMSMSNKITLIIEDQAEKVCNKIKKELN